MTVLTSYAQFRKNFATGSTLANDGYEEWPSDMLGANGFDEGIEGATIADFPAQLTVDGFANGAEAYHVFLSQRTDDQTKHWLSVERVAGKSGTYLVDLTDYALEQLGIEEGATLNDVQFIRILKHCTFYISRQSDQAIQFAELEAESLASQGED